MKRRLHSWNLAPRAAVALQRRLTERIIESALPKVRLVAGGDVSFSPDNARLVAGWVVWDIERNAVVAEAVVFRRVTFPYVPGLLSFREAPALLAAARKLTVSPDVYLIDGHGRAHPRGLGVASHLGLWLDRPTIGCAKSRLCGTFEPPDVERGASSELRLGGGVVGRVVRTRSGVSPVFVSVGHRVRLADAVRIVLACGGKVRLPEPARLAHALVTRAASRFR